LQIAKAHIIGIDDIVAIGVPIGKLGEAREAGATKELGGRDIPIAIRVMK